MIDVPCFDGCVGGHALEGDWQPYPLCLLGLRLCIRQDNGILVINPRYHISKLQVI